MMTERMEGDLGYPFDDPGAFKAPTRKTFRVENYPTDQLGREMLEEMSRLGLSGHVLTFPPHIKTVTAALMYNLKRHGMEIVIEQKQEGRVGAHLLVRVKDGVIPERPQVVLDRFWILRTAGLTRVSIEPEIWES